MNFPEMSKPMLVRVYLLGVYLLLRPDHSLSRPDGDMARRYFGDLDGDGLRETVLNVLAELESRGIKPYRL